MEASPGRCLVARAPELALSEPHFPECGCSLGLQFQGKVGVAKRALGQSLVLQSKKLGVCVHSGGSQCCVTHAGQICERLTCKQMLAYSYKPKNVTGKETCHQVTLVTTGGIASSLSN